MSDAWWHRNTPREENVLWSGRPDQGYFPPRYGWAYKAALFGLVFVWVSNPWMLDSVRDFWKLACVTLLLALTIWADRFVRSQTVYVVTVENAWVLHKTLKSKALKIDQFLNFQPGRRAITFDRHPFFAFDHLSDPDAALQALHQAKKAST